VSGLTRPRASKVECSRRRRRAVAAWLALSVVGPVGADELRRLDVFMVKYGGATGGASEQSYSQFRSFIQDRVQTLPEEVAGGSGELAYMGKLKLKELAGPRFPSLLDLEEYWKQTLPLAILQGTVFTPAGRDARVQSRIYLGDLSKSLPRRSLVVEMDISEEQFANASDSHSVVLLFALAVDAKNVYPEKKAVVAAILKAARDKLADLERRSAPLPKDLRELKLAISAIEASLKGP
jgi:hypothetical protein